ncbi:DMT family transporter [Anaeromicropila populeti]|uniref:Transporter family-2 protein n=1 Tax=Anaeromicropila populeti TaxID=37658 RepID=A0A1I6K599_9FIRM|nr:DMT family transporter [Anaeromicropila populeti]SFR86258.1 transporter family-2 protein [Anaeromicropila populeti]
MWGIFIALLSGALMSIQGVFNTGVTKQTSVWIAAGFVQLSALMVCVAAWFITGRESNFTDLFKIDGKYMLLGGVIGAFITYTVIQSMESLGPARAVMLIVTAQLAIAYIIELLGWFGAEKADFEWKKIIGLAITIAGIILFKWET